MDTQNVCTQCGEHCVPAQSFCPKCGSALPAVTQAVTQYAPVAPKFARLDAHERHLYTFMINLLVRKGWRQLKIPGWYATLSHFILHVTDKRILIEPYAAGKAEALAAQGISI